jgi:excinuclease ABC subunit C
VIDGGKGQLGAAIQARDDSGQSDIPFIGLAKSEEKIVTKGMEINRKKLHDLDGLYENSGEFILVDLPNSSHIIRLLQRIRDESHRFAVSYHTILKRNKQTASLLEEISGIGPKTRSKLVRKFGSLRGLKGASGDEVVELVGPTKAKLVKDYLKGL